MIKIGIKAIKIIGVLVGILISLIFIFNYTIEQKTDSRVFSDLSNVKHNRVGLVLGTSKHLGNGSVNLFFKYRVEATLELFHHNKIDFVLVSGDNGRVSYDEPTDFKEALIKGGIPKENIFLDYAGFRTLDSVVRAKKIFGLNNVTIISQKFHNQRAIYLADYYGIDAIGYNAKDVNGRNGKKVKLREYFARTKVFIDLLIHTEPKFLGDRIQIK